MTGTGSGSLVLALALLLLLCLEFDCASWLCRQNCFTLSLVANYATCETVPAPLSLSSSLSLSCSPSVVNLCLKVDIMNLKVVLRWQQWRSRQREV